MVKACINGDKTRVVYDGDKEKARLKLKGDQMESGDFKRINDLNLKMHIEAQLQILKDKKLIKSFKFINNDYVIVPNFVEENINFETERSKNDK